MTRPEWRKLDRLIKAFSKEDKGYRCEICGADNTQAQLHSHHFIGRTHASLRWVNENIFVLCASHHTMGRVSAHEDPQWFMKQAKLLRGDKWYKLIEKIKNKSNKKTLEENEALMGESLEVILKSYE